MKNIFKYSCVAIMATAALAFTACDDDDDYQRLTDVSGMQVYFDINTQTNYDIDATATSFTIPVKRAVTAEAANVPVNISFQPNSKFSCNDQTIVFASGSNTGSITINYDVNQFEFDEYEDFTITIGGEGYATEYGIAALNVHAGFPLPWSSIGVGTFDEEFYFGTGAMKCEIFQYDLDQYLYRIKNPIITALTKWGEDVSKDGSEWLYFRILQPGDEILGQTITEEHVGLVYFYSDYTAPNGGNPVSNLFNTGYHHPSYDEELCVVFPGRFTSLADPSNWTHNCVLGYKADGTPGAVQLAGNYYMFGVGGFGGQDQDGDIIITFPGFVLADYSADVRTVGRLIDAKENGQAIFNVTLGADVAQAKVAFDAGKDPNYAYEQIVNGDDAVVTLTASGEVRFAYDEPGDYVCLVVTYDANGNEQEAAYALINIPANGAPETYSAVFVGTYTHGVESYSQSGAIVWEDDETGEPYTESSVLYFCDQNEDKYMISPWLNAGWDEFGTQGKGLVFLMDDEGVVTVPGSSTYISDGQEDIIAVDLITANIADIPSAFDGDATISFSLIWTTESYLPKGSGYGFTMDTFVMEGFAEAPANKAGAKLCVPAAAKKMATFGKKNLINTEAKPAKKHTPLTFEWKKQLANLK